MDRLKDYIQQNREALDEIPLPEGHLERFAARVWKRKKPRKSFRYGISWFRWPRLLPCSSACLFLSGCISQFLLTRMSANFIQKWESYIPITECNWKII